jgi:excisionase family DNA binding protein
VAEYASCSSRTVYRWVREGRLPAWRLGAKSLRIDLDDVDALFQRIPTASGK